MHTSPPLTLHHLPTSGQGALSNPLADLDDLSVFHGLPSPSYNILKSGRLPLPVCFCDFCSVNATNNSKYRSVYVLIRSIFLTHTPIIMIPRGFPNENGVDFASSYEPPTTLPKYIISSTHHFWREHFGLVSYWFIC